MRSRQHVCLTDRQRHRTRLPKEHVVDAGSASCEQTECAETTPAEDAEEQPSDCIGNEKAFEENRIQTVHISNVPYNISECEIRKVFRPYAPVHNVVMIRDKNGRSRGFGFVVLDYQKAELAINDLNQKILLNRPLRLSKAGEKGRTA